VFFEFCGSTEPSGFAAGWLNSPSPW